MAGLYRTGGAGGGDGKSAGVRPCTTTSGMGRGARAAVGENLGFSPGNTTGGLADEAAEAVRTGDVVDDVVVYAPGDVAASRQAWTDEWNALITK